MRPAMTRTLAAVAMLSLAGAASGQKPNITGKYQVKGVGGDGARYTGTASISLMGGEMYNVTWTLGTKGYVGVCFRDEPALSCSSCPAGPSRSIPTVLSYVASATALDGVWIEGGNTRIGKELLTPRGKADKRTFAGDYVIKGSNPDGSAYTGTAGVTQLYAVSAYAYDFNWLIGTSRRLHGVGVRSQARDVISAGFCEGGKENTALDYTIGRDGKTLTGAFVMSTNGRVSTGTESLTRI